MTDPDEGALGRSGRLPLGYEPFQGRRRLLIHRRGGLIEKENRRIDDQRPHQGDDLALAPRQVVGVAVKESFAGANNLQEHGKALTRQRLPTALLQLESQPQILLHRAFEERRPLLHVDGLTANLWHPGIGDGLPHPENLSRIEWIQERQGPQDEALARTRGAHQAEPIPAGEIQIDLLEEPVGSGGSSPADPASGEQWHLQRAANPRDQVLPTALRTS